MQSMWGFSSTVCSMEEPRLGRPIWNFPTCRSRRRRWPSRNPDSATWPNLHKKTKSKARRHRAPACGPVGPAMSRRKSCSRRRGPRTTTPPSSSALSTDSTSSTNSLGRTSPPGSYGFTLAQGDDMAIQTGGPLSAALRLQFSANHSFWNVDLDHDHGAPSRPALFMRSECGVIDYR